jgi:hypothetical protein
MNKKSFLRFFEVLPHQGWDKFNFYLHGSILVDFDTANDIDIKLVPRESVTLNQISKSMLHTDEMARILGIPLDITFMRSVGHYRPKYMPSIQEVKDNDIPILMATNKMTAKEMDEKAEREIEKFGTNHFYPNVRWKQFGDLCFYISAEWAAGGYCFNNRYFFYSKKGIEEYTTIPNNNYNVDIREFVNGIR